MLRLPDIISPQATCQVCSQEPQEEGTTPLYILITSIAVSTVPICFSIIPAATGPAAGTLEIPPKMWYISSLDIWVIILLEKKKKGRYSLSTPVEWNIVGKYNPILHVVSEP